MKKVLITLLIALLLLPIGAQAKNIKSSSYPIYFSNQLVVTNGNGNEVIFDDNTNEDSNQDVINKVPPSNCSQLQTIKWFQKMFDYVKIIAPVLVLILSSVDYLKAIFSSQEDSMKKTNSRFIKRLIAAVLLFILPALLSFILNMTGDNFGNDLCGIK